MKPFQQGASAPGHPRALAQATDQFRDKRAGKPVTGCSGPLVKPTNGLVHQHTAQRFLAHVVRLDQRRQRRGHYLAHRNLGLTPPVSHRQRPTGHHARRLAGIGTGEPGLGQKRLEPLKRVTVQPNDHETGTETHNLSVDGVPTIHGAMMELETDGPLA